MTDRTTDDHGAPNPTHSGTASDRDFSAEGWRLVRGQPRRRFHRPGGRQRFSTDETTDATHDETTASNAVNAAPDPCNSCTGPSEGLSEGAGAPVYPLPPTPPIRLGDAAPRGPVDGYHPGRLAGVLPSGTLIHADYDGRLHDFGALRRERRAPTRPPIPRARLDLRGQTIFPLFFPEHLRRGRAVYDRMKPVIRQLAASWRRQAERARGDELEGARSLGIDRAAGLHPLSTSLHGIVSDEDYVLWRTHRTLCKRYGPNVSPMHVADVTERVLTWEPSGEPMVLDAHVGEFGIPEAFVAIGDVAYVRQAIVRLLMTVSSSGRGIIRGRGASALLTLAAAFESGYEVTLSLRPER